jgi:tetratricopeptide (TPR) repeat protein
VQQVTFSPDGRRVLTAAGTPGEPYGEVRVWDAVLGEPLSPPLRGNQWWSCWAAFDPVGSHVVAGDGNGAAVWELAPAEAPADDLRQLARLLTAHTLHPAGGMIPEDAGALQSAWDGRRVAYASSANPPAEELLAWHRQQADDSEAQRQWFAAAWHLGRLLDAGQADASTWARRGAARLALDDGDGAAADCAKAVELDPEPWQTWSDLGEAQARLGRKEQAAQSFAGAIQHGGKAPALWYKLALLRADARDQAMYRQACAEILGHFVKADDPGTVYLVALACGIRDGAGPDLREAVDAMRRVAAREGTARYLGGLGGLLVRIGDAQGAIKVLEDGIKAQGNSGDPWL